MTTWSVETSKRPHGQTSTRPTIDIKRAAFLSTFGRFDVWTFRVASGLALLMLAGCNDAQTGAVLGAGGGAGLGAIIGHQSGHGGEGALIGAGAGALIGYIVGNESDKAKQQEQQRQQRGTYDSRAY